MDEEVLIVSANPIILVGCFTIIILLAYLCARRFSDTNDFKRSSKWYGIAGIPAFIGFLIAGLPAILCIAYIICGFVIMAVFSNYFFNS